MEYSDFNTIHLLKNLFDQCQENNESDSDSEGNNASCSTFGPGNIKKSNKSQIKSTLENPLLKKIENDNNIKSLEMWEKLQKDDEELLDTRKEPEFSIAYKQVVTTEDIFLQNNLKTAATSSCEDMIIEIKLPEENVAVDQMDLNVKSDKIELSTAIYHLNLSLPHQIDPKKSRAEYDSTQKILKLILRMSREYDFMNF